MLAGTIVLEYRRDLRAQHLGVQSGSRVLPTACDDIECAEAGATNGPPLLLIHGSGGGFDQGLLARDRAPPAMRAIAPSHFGYLRRPMAEAIRV